MIAYLNATVVLVGLLGNAAALVVFSRPKFRPTIFHVYFRVLVVFDSIVLVAAMRAHLGADSFMVERLERLGLLCLLVQCTHFAERFSSPISGYILAAVALDRLVSITYRRHRGSLLNNRAFQLAACLLIAALNILVYTRVDTFGSGFVRDDDDDAFQIEYEFNATNGNVAVIDASAMDSPMCVFGEATYTDMYRLDFVNSSVLPFALMFMFTVATLAKIFVARRKANVQLVRRDVRFAFVSIGFNLTFLALTFPYTMRNIPALQHEHAVYELFNFMNLLNFGLTFFLSVLFNRIFRSELALMIGLKHQQHRNTKHCRAFSANCHL